MPRMLTTAARSAARFAGLVWRRDLRLERKRVGAAYDIEDGTYSIFRETYKPSATGESVVLVIGFRLKLIRSGRLLHWLFQRICVLTTPFWSGLSGFSVKLWMVDKQTKNYLGIYDWRGRSEAITYLEFLLPILRFFSVRGTVWAMPLYDQGFERYLSDHAIHQTITQPTLRWHAM